MGRLMSPDRFPIPVCAGTRALFSVVDDLMMLLETAYSKGRDNGYNRLVRINGCHPAPGSGRFSLYDYGFMID